MSAADHLSDLQFKFIPAPETAATGYLESHRVDALTQEGSRVGRIWWEPRNGSVEGINVHPARRRQGIGTRLWYEAHANAQREGLVHPVHSDVQLPDGKAWAAGLTLNSAKNRGTTTRKPKASPSPDQATLF